MSPTPILRGLIPWMLFAVFTIPDGDRATLLAAIVALVWASASTLLDLYRRQAVEIVDVCAVVVFAICTTVGTVGDAAAQQSLADQGRGLAAAALAAVMLVSAAVSPFTEQYARQTVPAVYWSSPVFRSIHRDLSIRWGVAIVVVAIGYLAAADLHAAQGSDIVEFALTWILPAAAIVVAVGTTRSSTAPQESRRLFRSGTP